MRLSLPIAPPWQLAEPTADRSVAILPEADAVVTFGPLVLRPDEPRRWIDAALRREVPGTGLELGPESEHATRCGWPLRLIEARAVGAPDVRMCALFTFLEHAGLAIVRVPDRARFVEHRAAILALLDGGRPDWRGDPVCLADLWDLGAAP